MPLAWRTSRDKLVRRRALKSPSPRTARVPRKPADTSDSSAIRSAPARLPPALRPQHGCLRGSLERSTNEFGVEVARAPPFSGDERPALAREGGPSMPRRLTILLALSILFVQATPAQAHDLRLIDWRIDPILPFQPVGTYVTFQSTTKYLQPGLTDDILASVIGRCQRPDGTFRNCPNITPPGAWCGFDCSEMTVRISPFCSALGLTGPPRWDIVKTRGDGAIIHHGRRYDRDARTSPTAPVKCP